MQESLCSLACLFFFLSRVFAAPQAVTLSPPLNPVNHSSTNNTNPLTFSLSNSTNTTAQASSLNCRDTTVLHPECWDILNVTEYVREYWNRSSDTCAQEYDGSFSRCFMSSLHYYEQDCTGIKPDSCTSAFSKLNLSAEEYYVAWNIYAIATFFTDYWQALEMANGLASKKIDAITGVINPPLDTSTPLDSILLALQAAFSFVILDTKPIEKAIQSSPSVGTVIYPPGSTDSRFLQLGQIKEQLSDLINGYQHNVSDAIAKIENDVDTFIIFASSGSFNSDLPSMQNQSDTILQALMTMVVSLSLKANKIVVTRSIGMDPRRLESEYANTTYGLAYDLGCQGYNALGMCGPWWYDASTNTTYSLDNLDHMDKDYTDLLGTIFTNYTTPELLFAGASLCHDSILAQSPPLSYNTTSTDAAAITDTPQVMYSASRHRRDTSIVPGAVQGIDANGIETSCISAVDVCTYNMTCSPDVYCEFTDCPIQNNFGTAGCSYNADGSLETVNVPFAYLGPWLWGATADTIVCR